MLVTSFEVTGLDPFELTFPKQNMKVRYTLYVDLASNVLAVSMNKIGQASEVMGSDGGDAFIEGFARDWLQHKPKPRWVVTDPQPSLCDGAFADFLGNAGIGHLATPGEAHWLLGAVESSIGVVKKTMKRLRECYPDMDPEVLASACRGGAQQLGTSERLCSDTMGLWEIPGGQ